MKRTIGGIAVVIGLVSAPGHAAEQCPYDHQLFSSGWVSCQKGSQFRCVDGKWQDLGLRCADQDAHDGGVRVQPGVNEPAVTDPAVKQPKAPAVPTPGAP